MVVDHEVPTSDITQYNPAMRVLSSPITPLIILALLPLLALALFLGLTNDSGLSWSGLESYMLATMGLLPLLYGFAVLVYAGAALVAVIPALLFLQVVDNVLAAWLWSMVFVCGCFFFYIAVGAAT